MNNRVSIVFSGIRYTHIYIFIYIFFYKHKAFIETKPYLISKKEMTMKKMVPLIDDNVTDYRTY